MTHDQNEDEVELIFSAKEYEFLERVSKENGVQIHDVIGFKLWVWKKEETDRRNRKRARMIYPLREPDNLR
jgi:hypothetical protein